jgi:putative membrane protein
MLPAAIEPYVTAGERVIAAAILRAQHAQVAFSGREHLPASGPALIVAHHYHHLLDGAVLVRATTRPMRIVVALDWTRDRGQRRTMERLCGWAGWPIVLRAETFGATGSFSSEERLRYLRGGLRTASDLLRAGELVVVFPEGYPVVDSDDKPVTTRPRDDDGFLPFADGFRTIARLAARGGTQIPVVPFGLRYLRTGEGWQIDARFGAPLAADVSATDAEAAVRALSR